MKLIDLMEMSRQISFDYEKADKNIVKILKKNNIEDFSLEDKTLDLYKVLNSPSGEYWYVIFNDEKDDIDFIVKFKEYMIGANDKNYKVLTSYFTYKKRNSSKLKGITKKVYSYINKKFKKPILSDKKQTAEMMVLWLDWFENQSKYGVKDFKFVDEEKQKILRIEELGNLGYGFHGGFELHEKYRMMVDFHQLIKESEPIVLEKRSQGIFFGKEGRDWILKND